MFDVAMLLLEKMIYLIPGVFGIYVLFDMVGMLLFDKR